MHVLVASSFYSIRIVFVRLLFYMDNACPCSQFLVCVSLVVVVHVCVCVCACACVA